jgi:hypothetical protein
MNEDVVSWRNNLLANPPPEEIVNPDSTNGSEQPSKWLQNPLCTADPDPPPGYAESPTGAFSSPVYSDPGSSDLEHAPHIKYQTPYENFIFHVTYVVATNFGFQVSGSCGEAAMLQ